MLVTELFEDVSSSKLYHATKLQYCKDQLQHDRVMAAMIHRFWKDGKRRERGDPGYDDHVWIKGLSLSRNLRFCLKWGILVFELDRELLKRKYKLLPITWFSQNTADPKGTYRRRESEEYLWIDTSNISGDGPEPVKYADKEVFIDGWHKYCTKIYVSSFYLENRTVHYYHEFLYAVQAFGEKYKIPVEVLSPEARVLGNVDYYLDVKQAA